MLGPLECTCEAAPTGFAEVSTPSPTQQSIRGCRKWRRRTRVSVFAEPYVTVSRRNRVLPWLVIALCARNALEVRLALQRSLMNRQFKASLRPTFERAWRCIGWPLLPDLGGFERPPQNRRGGLVAENFPPHLHSENCPACALADLSRLTVCCDQRDFHIVMRYNDRVLIVRCLNPTCNRQALVPKRS